MYEYIFCAGPPGACPVNLALNRSCAGFEVAETTQVSVLSATAWPGDHAANLDSVHAASLRLKVGLSRLSGGAPLAAGAPGARWRPLPPVPCIPSGSASGTCASKPNCNARKAKPTALLFCVLLLARGAAPAASAHGCRGVRQHPAGEVQGILRGLGEEPRPGIAETPRRSPHALRISTSNQRFESALRISSSNGLPKRAQSRGERSFLVTQL